MILNLEKLNKIDFSNQESLEQIASIVHSLFLTNHSYLTSLAKCWDTNIRFFEGDQWIYYDQSKKANAQIPIIEGVNDFIPRPVSNIIAPSLMTIVSLFTKNKPTALVFPNSEEQEDKQAARVAESIIDTKWEIDDEASKHVKAMMIALLMGTVFRKDYWDPTATVTNIQPDGLEDDMEIGDTKIDMLTPFEVYPDIYGQRYFIEAKVVAIEDIKMIYGRVGNGFTGLADKVKADKTYNSILQYRENLRTLTPNGYTYGSSQGTAHSTETAVLVEAYIKPTRHFPKGLMVVECNGIPLYCRDSPYFDKRVEDSWHPYTIFKWLESPTKWHGLSLAEQIVPHQRRINGIDSFIMLSNMSNINPVWLINKASNIPEGYINGRPSLHIYYTGEAPQRLPGLGLPQDIYVERQRLVEEVHFIVGDNQVLHGSQPSGVKTASGLQLLNEQSASKFNPYFTNYEKFIEKGQQKKLLLIAKNYVKNRTDIVNKIKGLSRHSSSIDIKTFLGADLRDNLTIRIEAGSSIPRSKLVEQQQLLDLQQRGLLGDVSPQANPVANQKFLEKFGVAKFDGITNPDIVKSNYVVGVLKQINDDKLPESDYPQLLPFENVDIHMQTLVNEMKRPEFSDPKGVFEQKFEELQTAKEAQLQALQPIAPMPQPPPGEPPASPEEMQKILGNGDQYMPQQMPEL